MSTIFFDEIESDTDSETESESEEENFPIDLWKICCVFVRLKSAVHCICNVIIMHTKIQTK